MPVAAEMKDVDSWLQELLEKEGGALPAERGLLRQGPEASPVKVAQSVIGVAPGDREQRDCVISWRWLQARSTSLQGLDGGRAVSSGHSQVILGVMLTGHQEGQCVIDLEADCGVFDAWLGG